MGDAFTDRMSGNRFTPNSSSDDMLEADIDEFLETGLIFPKNDPCPDEDHLPKADTQSA